MKRFYLSECNDIDASSLDANYRLADLLEGELDLADDYNDFDLDLELVSSEDESECF